ncbi:DMT family transporter [Ahrensia sp. 13_GOM-1096m]|uniref:DMT family transporter n=1 Tax=Ahrensia sp. 13_GOM-1096m TaxID=1380380 RepID=UPI00047A8D7D|nr:DMT family transporter [Ahrensia sp. 13_GOM-1096m]
MALALIQNNLRAIILMVVSMALFAVEDAMIKFSSLKLDVGQILFVLSLAGFISFAIIARLQNEKLFTAKLLKTPVVLRNLGEVIAAFAFVTALTRMPLSNASAILQATPLMVTLGAAIFLKEPVGWRRWSAILIGFTGVIIIIRPGMAGFNAASILALIGVAGISLRDLATRRVDVNISTAVVSAIAFLTLAIPSYFLMEFQGGWQPINSATFWYLFTACLVGPAGYYCIVHSVRLGEMGTIAPFRYTRLIFAIFIGYFFLQERPDLLMIIGSILVIASGIYAIYRERIRALELKKLNPQPQ